MNDSVKKRSFRILAVFMVLVLAVTCFQVNTAAVQAKAKPKKVVILYFSATGTTKSV